MKLIRLVSLFICVLIVFVMSSCSSDAPHTDISKDINSCETLDIVIL